MAYLYFDESIRDKGGFIVGAVVVSEDDLTPLVHGKWRELGMDPTRFEYKSRNVKASAEDAIRHRDEIHALLERAQLGIVVCPAEDRASLGAHAVSLSMQLVAKGCINPGPHIFFIDQGIKLTDEDIAGAHALGIEVRGEQDSKAIGGLQLADHVSHLLGSLLLEQMGLLTKTVRAGENSGYDPDMERELGYELWASLRYYIISAPAETSGIDPEDWFAVRPVDTFGLYIAPSCGSELRAFAGDRFGTNYLGCIH